MKLNNFDYQLPKNLIAQKPIRPRDHSRLFVYDKIQDEIQHKHFYDLPKFLKAGDVLVLNNSKVFPARLNGKKTTGGKIEIFLLQQLVHSSGQKNSLIQSYGNKKNYWEVMIGGRIKNPGRKIIITKNLFCTTIKKKSDNTWLVIFNLTGKKFWQEIYKVGEAPTPPYIKPKSNLKEYQTIFAKPCGSVAAPTAGFHFTDKLLNKIKSQGAKIEFITLHVGLGTFAPVKESTIEKHQIHSEWAEITPATAQRINAAKSAKHRLIAVGTTSARALEYFAKISNKNQHLTAGQTSVDLFIYPGYEFKIVDALITNFHLPKSTLLMLVATFLSQNKTKKSGSKKIKELYKTAIKNKYRFYSFGDAMFIY